MTMRAKFQPEIFIETTWNLIRAYIIELVTGTWLEFFILDTTGQYLTITLVALMLAMCVGHILTTVKTTFAPKGPH